MKNSQSIRRAAMAAAVSTALLVGGAATAEASVPAAPSAPAVAAIAVSDLVADGYTLKEIEAAIANSPYVTIGDAPRPRIGGVSTKGVSYGKFIYVRISQATAKAINASSAAAAVGILGLVTGGTGAIIAGAIYAYIGSLNDSALSRCARWEFRLTYPLPLVGSKIVYADCY